MEDSRQRMRMEETLKMKQQEESNRIKDLIGPSDNSYKEPAPQYYQPKMMIDDVDAVSRSSVQSKRSRESKKHE